ncbi:MAG: APC family permease [Pyrinomonadaceae bacterium]
MKETDEGLSRGITKWDLVALFVNVTVGAGIFRLPADVQRAVGNYSLAAFVVCAVIIGLIALCFAEVGSRFKRTGGPYLYARATFGPTLGFIVGWLMWLTRLAGFATLTQVFVAYLSYFWPAAGSGLPRVLIICGLVLFLTIINIAGVKDSARASDILTVSKLIPLLLFVAVGLFFISPASFALPARPNLEAFSGAVFVLIYVFSGFEAVLVNSGEIREPQRAIPFALLFALALAVALFLLIQVVCIGTLPQLSSSQRPLADASRNFLGVLGPSIISATALVAILGTLNAVMLALTRLPFSMAVESQLPRCLARVHRRFHTPHVSILISAAAVLLLALTGTFMYAVRVTVVTRVIVYVSTCVALLVLRRRDKMIGSARNQGPPTAFELPAGGLISIVCVILCLWLLTNSNWREVRDVAIAVSVGLVLFAATRFFQKKSEPVGFDR